MFFLKRKTILPALIGAYLLIELIGKHIINVNNLDINI